MKVSCASLVQQRQKLNQTAVDQDVSGLSSPCMVESSYICIVAAFLFILSLLGSLHCCPSDSKLSGSTEKAPTARNPFPDNAKFLGMVLVCWSHIGSFDIRGTKMEIHATDVIWFHMPLFIFLSGSFSRPFSSKGFLKLVVTLVMPLIFFISIIYPLLQLLMPSKTWAELQFRSWFPFGMWLYTEPLFEGVQSSPLTVWTGAGPGYFIWFLRCLILWRFVTMFTVRWPKFLQIALGLSCGVLGVYWGPDSANPWEIGTFAYQRALCLFPFYLMGQHLDLGRLLQAVPAPSSSCVLLVWATLFSLIYLENKPAVWNSVTDGAFDVIETDTAPFLRYPPPAPGCQEDYKFLWARYFAAVAYRYFVAEQN
ncbi:ykrP [Symbiodinium pilosum]|uniref:YkrP protein n=1 Tax=Symbiodinium pilosum TaxID=2952 RepID=A0A812XL23_SYMPI|nr:ykrP [Symbiodinium pilosum]